MNIQDKVVVFQLTQDSNLFNIEDLKSINVGKKFFIADVREVSIELLKKVKNKFVKFDQTISNLNGSFVIVSKFSFDNDLKIVPTIQEAYDYIEMEEIEKQL
tara:strand:+ start:5324 stop:5629 length:306 start_codon:yes stop_codon:yes gene_type:complete